MKVSVVIPYYESDPEKLEVLKECTQSLKGHDEVVVVWNDRMGYTPAINRGLATATGDFMVVMNDDVRLIQGDLTMLCDETSVVSPSNNGRIYPHIWGSCFCLPRWVYEATGGMSEDYDISYFDDDDFIFTLQDMKIPMRSQDNVIFDHPRPGRTLETMPDRDEFFERNKQRFLDKWGRLP